MTELSGVLIRPGRMLLSERLLGQLGEVFGFVGFELFHAGFAAKLDLLTVIDLGHRRTHASELITADETLFEGIRFVGGLDGSSGNENADGGEECFHSNSRVRRVFWFFDEVFPIKSG
jgi:hypothetical protein